MVYTAILKNNLGLRTRRVMRRLIYYVSDTSPHGPVCPGHCIISSCSRENKGSWDSYYEVKSRPGPSPIGNLLDAWPWHPKVGLGALSMPIYHQGLREHAPLSQSPPTRGSIPRVGEHWKHNRR